MILNNQSVKRIFLSVSIALSIFAIVLKQTIESTMIATPSTTIIPASILISISSFLLIVYTVTSGGIEKYIFLVAMILLSVKEFLWAGSTLSIILYIILVVSLFKPVQHKTLNVIAIIDCVIKTSLTFWYISDNISYYGSFYYATPSIIGLFASLCLSFGICAIVFNPTTK